MHHNPRKNHWLPQSDSDDERLDHHRGGPPYPPGTQGTSSRGCLVTFYRNGDPHFKGLRTSVSHKLFATFDTLTTWLSEKLALQSGAVRFVFALPDGRPVFNLGQFVTGRSYVASSVARVDNVTYGESREKFWHNKPASALNRTYLHDSSSDPTDVKRAKKQRRKNQKVPYSYPTSRVSSLESKAQSLRFVRYGLDRPRMLVIRSNTRRASQLKILFNPRTVQVYEDLLVDTTNALDLDYPPVVSLYTAKPPFRKVMGISHLMKGLRSHYEFLACGRELVPLELSPNQPPPLPLPSVEPRKILAPKQLPLKPRLTAWNSLGEPPLQYDDRPAYVLHHQRPGADPWIQQRMPPIDGYEEEEEVVNHQLPRVIHSQEISPPVEPEVPGPLPVHHPIRYDPPQDQSNPSTLPYRRKTVSNNESVKVHINGTLKEFFIPRYVSGDGDLSKPDKRLQLEWVYGYQGKETGNNLHVLPSGELVYHVTGIGIVFDRKNYRQTHYLGHTNDITCIALHPDRRHPFVATGQKSGRTAETKSQIRVWDPHSMNTLTILDLDDLHASVTSVQFSNKSGDSDDGHFLLSVDDSEQHVLRLWDWRSHVFIAKTTTSSSGVVGASFHPIDPSTIVTFGEYHIYFWKVSVLDDRLKKEGRILRDKQSGIFETDFPIPKIVTSLTFGQNGDVIAGTSNGDVIVWSQNEASAYVINSVLSRNMLHVHQGPVLSVCMLSGGILLSSGGSEIKSWDSKNDYILTQTKIIPERAGHIRRIVPRNLDARDGVLYLGTTTNNILQETLNDSKYSYCIQGQGDELYALASHPTDSSLFVAAGCDCSVSQWHTRRHRNQWRVQVEKPCLSVTYDPSGRLLVVGTKAGRFIVLSSASGEYVTSVQAGSEPLEGLSFSPDGRFLAVGSHDRMIYIYSILDQGRSYQRHRSGLLEGHKGSVKNVDWSKDSKTIQSVSSEHPDLRFWDVIEMREKTAASMRDVDWQTQTCSIGYEVLGAWSNLRLGQEITCLTRSNARNLLAVGHNTGLVSLYRFPCTAERPDSDRHRIGSGRLTGVCFSGDDDRLITASSRDGIMMQWQLATTTSTMDNLTLSNQGGAYTHRYDSIS